MSIVETPAFEQITPREAAMLGSKSLKAFGRLFFPKTVRQESAPFHDLMDAALMSPARYNAFAIFRGGAKTTKLRIYKAQRISYGLSRTVMYISSSQAHSAMSVRWLRRQIMFNQRWAQTFGLRKGEKWTDEHCEVYHGVEENPITLLAMGVTGQVRGFNPDDYRPDLILLDDVLTDENTATPEQRKKIEELIFGAILNSLAPASESPFAKAVFNQTPFHKEDAIEKCLRDPEWNPLRIGCFDERGESRWAARFPTEVLQKAKEAHIRRSQYRLWMREMECQIVAGEEKALDVTKLKHYDVLPEYLDCIISIDPASSDSATADDHAIVALGFKGLDVYVLDYAMAKAVMPDKAANDFFQLAMMYTPRKAAVESISYQRVLKWYLEQEMVKRRIFVAIEAVQDKRSKATRIMQAIPGYLAYGHFLIRPTMSELITQMDDYDPQVKDQPDDLLDAIATGIISMNPALRQRGADIEGEFHEVESEEEYPRLRFGGCP
jgi:hypothetical protein